MNFKFNVLAIKLFFTSISVCFICFTTYSYQNSIIAYVNEDIITTYDLENRKNLIESINKTNLLEAAKKEILEMLIDEELLSQIAERNDMSISKEQIKLYANEIARENGFTNLNKIIVHFNISQEEFIKQITAQLLLKKFIARKIKLETVISKQEVLDNTEVISKNIKHFIGINPNSKIKIYEIVLYKRQTNKEDILTVINNLYFQLRKDASFESLAKQFSQSHSASNGGLIGWVKLKQLSKPIINALESQLDKFKTEKVTKPIETDDRIILLKLADVKRDKKAFKKLNALEVKNILYKQRLKINLRNFIKDLRKNSYIMIKN